MEKIKDEIEFTGNIYNKEIHLKSTDKDYESSYMNIYDREICSDLKKLNIISNKSLVLGRFDFIPDEYEMNFLLGVFDGDGSVFISNEKHWRHGKIFPVIHFRFCGTKWFCSELQTILNIGGRLSHPKKAHKDFVELAYKRNKKAKYFFNYLYKDATIYLQRKKNKFEDIMTMDALKDKLKDVT